MRTCRRTRPSRVWLLLTACVLGGSRPGSALADDRTTFLIERLKSDDFRVRGQAALQLGRTNDEVAVQPLCGALGDDSDFVRNAAVAALKRLAKPSAVPCLTARRGVETNQDAKTQIDAALAALSAASGGGGGAPTNNPNAKYYVAVSRVTNNTGRPDADVTGIVMGAIQAKIDQLGTVQLAPTGESPEAARGVLSSRHLKGYYISVRVEAFDYSGGNLKVKLSFTVFSYPGKAMKGEFPVAPVQSGVSPGDKSSEDNLMQMAAGHGVEVFAQNFQ